MIVTLEDNHFHIKGDLHRFCKWKNPLIDALARANGCKLQVLKVRTGEKNVILFGQAANATKAVKKDFPAIERAANKACCDRMRLDGVAIPNYTYAKSYYFGYVEGIGLLLRDEIASHANEVDEVARKFPQTSAPYPVSTNIDPRIADAGRNDGLQYKIIR